MIDSTVTAIVHNITAEINGKEPCETATWNAICLADMGDTGAAFVHYRKYQHVMSHGSRKMNGCTWRRWPRKSIFCPG